MKLSYLEQYSPTCSIFFVEPDDTAPFKIYATPVGFALPNESRFAAVWCARNKGKIERSLKKHRRNFAHAVAKLS